VYSQQHNQYWFPLFFMGLIKGPVWVSWLGWRQNLGLRRQQKMSSMHEKSKIFLALQRATYLCGGCKLCG